MLTLVQDTIYMGTAAPSGGGSGNAVWGAITGTLSDQTDLQTALNAKQDTLTAGSNVSIASDGTISATDTTYSAFTGTDGTTTGSAGLVPAPTTSDADKYLKSNGTWSSVSGGGTVDQTYDATSPNAQSGVAIDGAGFLKNKATRTGSLAILGTSTSSYGTAIGSGAVSEQNSVAVGYRSKVTSWDSVAMGRDTSVAYNKGIAIGAYAVSRANYAIQLNNGTNSEANSFYVGLSDSNNYKLLGSNGKIPNDRLNTLVGADGTNAGTAGIVPAPSATDNTKYLRGDGTWAAVSGGSGSGIQNTATGRDSLTILGEPNSNGWSINIGEGSIAGQDGIAIGVLDEGSSTSAGDYSIAMGMNAQTGNYSIGIYGSTDVNREYNIAIGYGSYISSEYSIALGCNAMSTSDNEFVVGFGVDENLQSISYKLLDGTTGKIPNDRINGVSGSFTSQDGKTVTVTNGVITSIV